MDLRRKLKADRCQAVVAEFSPGLDQCPAECVSHFCSIGGAAEQALLVSKLIGGGRKRVLVVGVFGGRDYWWMKVLGHDVRGLNLTPDVNCPDCSIGNAEDPWPFDDESFDVIILGEILEHLVKDHLALQQAYRVLTRDGKLIVTVPFLHDEPDYHIRVHTPASVKRLVEQFQFSIDCYVERPGIPFKGAANVAINAYMMLMLKMTNRTHYRSVLRALASAEYSLGRSFTLLRAVAGKARITNWGCTIAASKSATPKDSYLSVNQAQFGRGGAETV
ncbi:MAG: methyltransferase domain-containing protein [Dyella sp.]|nr:methyltransferase domain-containing protein [Dyella sp.]